MTWPQLQTFFKGKQFLIGLTFMDEDNSLIEEWETSGRVESLTDDGLLVFRRADGSLFQLPYEPETVHTAEKGDYRERATGLIITDPDFITTWKIKVKDSATIAELKSKGYVE